ncbi:deoxycytidine deaminase [Gloeocapsa sp. BRSZ]
MFSDEDIKEELDKGITINPFKPEYLTPIGYDLRVGEFGFSWKTHKKIEIQKEKLLIEPDDTVVIQTYESVKLSKQFGATIHSMVTQVVRRGLSHISTTIDPGWSGTLLVSVHNYRASAIELEFGEPFCTVCFYKMQSATKQDIRISPNRDDIWRELLELARREKEKIQLEKRKEEEKKEKEYRDRQTCLVALVVLVLIFGGFMSFKNPNVGASLGAFLGVVGFLIVEILKPRSI